MVRVIVASVGFVWDRVIRAIGRIGLSEGDVVLLFNSEPKVDKAVEAMDKIKKWVEDIFPDVVVELNWLDPRNSFEQNVALIRRKVEEYSPCRSWFLAIGGFRWLTLAVSYAAFAVHTIGELRNIVVESLELELEEDTHSRDTIRKMFPTAEQRIIKIPVLIKLTNIDSQDIIILKAIANGTRKTKQLSQELKIPRATLQRKLNQLVKKELLTYEKKGRNYIYNLTSLAQIIVQ